MSDTPRSAREQFPRPSSGWSQWREMCDLIDALRAELASPQIQAAADAYAKVHAEMAGDSPGPFCVTRYNAAVAALLESALAVARVAEQGAEQ